MTSDKYGLGLRGMSRVCLNTTDADFERRMKTADISDKLRAIVPAVENLLTWEITAVRISVTDHDYAAKAVDRFTELGHEAQMTESELGYNIEVYNRRSA